MSSITAGFPTVRSGSRPLVLTAALLFRFTPSARSAPRRNARDGHDPELNRRFLRARRPARQLPDAGRSSLAMEQRRLGEAGLAVPAIGAGTWRVFDVSEDATAGPNEVVEEVLAAGGKLFDCSPMYGRAERVLSRALRQRRGEARSARSPPRPQYGRGSRRRRYRRRKSESAFRLARACHVCTRP